MNQRNSLRTVVEQADQLYAGRNDVSNVKKSIELLETCQNKAFESDWRLSRANFFLGQEIEISALRFHHDGINAGRLAARERPERVEGHFWLGVNLALLAQRESVFKALIHVLQAKRALQRAIAIDAAYHGAGPLRVLARLQHKLPRLLGGGREKAADKYRQAILIAPSNTVTRIYFAELLLEMKEPNKARAQLEALLKAPLDPDWGFEIERDQKLAEERIRSLKKGSGIES
ncbi:MAG TPA: TRAP transporter TatT component family protein [Pyrinomonadaceae bacterium]|nr:TRAP transporter TatT component family protein [Pyrinomonadaceae bacterium]